MWKVHPWLRDCLVFTLGFFWPASLSLHVSLTWLLSKEASVCCYIHYALGQHCLFTPHNLFLIFHIFSIIEKLCGGYPSNSKKKSHLSCHSKQSHCWKYLFLEAMNGWVHSSVFFPCLSSYCAVETVNIFWLAHMVNVTFTKEIISFVLRVVCRQMSLSEKLDWNFLI